MLLALPTELKIAIARLLVAFLDAEHACAHVLARKTRHPTDSFRDLANLSMTCREWRAICSEVLVQGVRLIGEQSHKRFLRDLDSAPGHTMKRVKFLSFGNPASCDRCGFSCEDKLHGHDYTVQRIIEHFSSVTVLELTDFPFTAYSLRTLAALRRLKTLYVRNPDPRQTAIVRPRKYSRVSKLPLERLFVVIDTIDQAKTLSFILRFFKHSLASISLKSEAHNAFASGDFLKTGALYLSNPGDTEGLRNLRHLHIGYLPTTASTLWYTIENLPSLESLAVDCHGVRPNGTLPLSYVLDMLSMSVNLFTDKMRNPHVDDAKIWRRSIASFAFAFGPVNWAKGMRKTVEELQLIFASCDADGTPANADMRFDELAEVFRDRATMLYALKSLSIRMADEGHFDSKETQHSRFTRMPPTPWFVRTSLHWSGSISSGVMFGLHSNHARRPRTCQKNNDY